SSTLFHVIRCVRCYLPLICRGIVLRITIAIHTHNHIAAIRYYLSGLHLARMDDFKLTLLRNNGRIT
ncbi:hypothetical protein KI387_015986, partial [Taxus chinensis]